jgi:hypothetical protein
MSPELPETLRVAFLIIDALESLAVHYHLGGSLASSVHGVPRQTQDVDLVVDLDPTQVADLVDRLATDFHVDADRARRSILEGTSFNLIHFDTGIKIDLFPVGPGPFDREELARGRREVLVSDPERTACVKTPEDTILRKLAWYREGGEVSDRQWSDVLGVIRTQDTRLDRSYLEQWADELGVGELLQRALGESE